jgi:hypothetical protein
MSMVAPTDMIESVAPQETQQIELQYIAAIVAPQTTNKLARNSCREEEAARVASTSRVNTQLIKPRI